VSTLYLLRHAKSSWADPALDDHDRPLAPRGHLACELLARHCEAARVAPELVLCSSALRTLETLEAIRGALGDPPVEVDPGLYHSPAEHLRARIARTDAASLMLVGHNPGLQELAVELASPGVLRDRVAGKLPTGALVTLVVDAGSRFEWGSATLNELVTPRALEADTRERTEQFVVRSLAARAQTRHEIATKLAARRVPDAIAEAVLERARELGYLDDSAVAGQSARSQRERGYGRRRAAQTLRSRGISDELVRAALDAAYDAADEVADARAALGRRAFGEGEAGRRRAAAFLARRGFSSATVWAALGEPED
jgi:phosphohistidine phosphatase